jgi:hypothetical protein
MLTSQEVDGSGVLGSGTADRHEKVGRASMAFLVDTGTADQRMMVEVPGERLLLIEVPGGWGLRPIDCGVVGARRHGFSGSSVG